MFFYRKYANQVLFTSPVTVYSRHRAGYCSQPAAFLTNHSAPSYIARLLTLVDSPIRLSLSLPPAKILATQIESPTFHYRTLALRSTFVWTNPRRFRRCEFVYLISSVRQATISSSDFTFKWLWTLFPRALALYRGKRFQELYLRVQCWHFHCYITVPFPCPRDFQPWCGSCKVHFRVRVFRS